ncbi:twinfilin-1 [Diutina catenulata]
MSTQSGITAAPELLERSQQLDSPLIVKIDQDALQLVPDNAFSGSAGSLEQSFADVHNYLEQTYPEPKYVILPTETSGEYAFVAFVPDDAPMRQKMLYASTKNTLLQSLGSGKFPKNKSFAWTELDEFTYDFYQRSVADSKSTGPLTEDEQVLGAMNKMGDLQVGKRQLASMGTQDKLLYPFESDLERAFESVKSPGQVVVFDIDLEGEKVRLTSEHSGVKASGIVSTLESATQSSSPHYALFQYAPEGTAFIYTCPSGSKVKERMLYASFKSGLINHLKQYGITVTKNAEVGDLDELETSQFEEQKDTAQEDNKAGLKFSKPRGPRRR